MTSGKVMPKVSQLDKSCVLIIVLWLAHLSPFNLRWKVIRHHPLRICDSMLLSTFTVYIHHLFEVPKPFQYPTRKLPNLQPSPLPLPSSLVAISLSVSLVSLVCLCACVCSCMHAWECVQARGWLKLYYSLCSTFVFEDKASHWTWKSLVGLDWLTSKPQGSLFLFFLGAGIISVPSFLVRAGHPNSGPPCLCGRHFADSLSFAFNHWANWFMFLTTRGS